MITIDLEDNDDCVIVRRELEQPQKIKNDLKFKKKLIIQVRKHRLLYDNKDKLFSNVAKKDIVWQQIANKLKSNVDNCKDTWFELRYRYQSHARKLRRYFMTGQKENCKRPAMSLESELMFLWRFIDDKKTTKHEIPEFQTKEIEVKPDLVENNSLKEKAILEHQKQIDDDLILVEQPVELIVIDEDDDNNKSEKQFKLNSSMKKLILEIKKYPELYNVNHLDFKNYTKKSSVWNAIASSMGDKATKLMKCWIVMITRYEWEICQTGNKADESELQVELKFFKNFVLSNNDTVYKQSYYLKSAWYDPIDYFKDIYNLIVRMKKVSDIVYITDCLLTKPEKNKQYLSLWTEVANLKNSSPGQCETTWLIMRHFYWELMNMRIQNYQLTDKWYFETIITELYAISKSAQKSKLDELQVLQQNKLHKKANKRSAQTNAIPQGAPAYKRSSPTMQMPLTITYDSTINTQLKAQPTTGPALTLPKITAAISLAPQALNAGGLQIKAIPGPPALSPAPQQFNMPNVTVTNGNHPATIVPTQTTMSFNLPTQTKVTAITMPTLIRPLIPGNTQPAVRNTTAATITVRPQAVIRPVAPQIQIAPWATIPPSNINSIVNPQITANIPAPVQNYSSNQTYSSAASANSIASVKMTTVPTVTTATNSFNLPSSTSTTTTIASTSNTTANTSQLPKITGAISLLNPNEILIELIASHNGNQLVVHGPPLSNKYQLPMPMVAKFIREVLAIPLLHNKRKAQPTQFSYYWEHISKKFNLPVHICRACWNFLLENFNHFPQIAPMKDLMKPFKTTLPVWITPFSSHVFKNFEENCVSKGWDNHAKIFPDIVDCIKDYPVLYQDVSKQHSSKNFTDMEALCAWRTINLRFSKITDIPDIWISLKSCYMQYIIDLEDGIDNKWPEKWWRSLARMKFLVEAKYSANEPFYYIIKNKIVEQIDKFATREMEQRSKQENTPEVEDSKNNNDVFTAILALTEKRKAEVELGALITAVQKYPVIYNKADNLIKYEAWQKVAQELNMEVPDCLVAFKEAAKKYFAYKKQDSANRCRLNEKYYKKFEDIVQSLPSCKLTTCPAKINIKTPFELNQSLEMDILSDTSDLVFPERFISDITMSNSPTNLVVKNWAFAFGSIPSMNASIHIKLKDILKKYIPDIK